MGPPLDNLNTTKKMLLTGRILLAVKYLLVLAIRATMSLKDIRGDLW